MELPFLDFFINNPREVVRMLLFIGGLWILFYSGIRCANTPNESYAWYDYIVFFALLFALFSLMERNLVGYYGLIPFGTYILLKLNNLLDFEYSTKRKIQGTIFSAIASALTYASTHTLLGFGVTEASVSSILAATILGIVGFTS